MGWISLVRKTVPETAERSDSSNSTLKTVTEHIENLEVSPHRSQDVQAAQIQQQFPHALPTIADIELPFVTSEAVKKRKSGAEGGLWIVVDDIVYDCTEFISEHPGGEEVIKSFGGEECSWQVRQPY